MQNVPQGNGKVGPKVDNSSSKVNVVKRGSESTSTHSETGTYSEQHKRFMTDTSESEEESVSEVASFLIDQDFEEDPQVEAAKFLLSHQGDRVDPETQERLEALLRAAGIGQLTTKDGKHLADPEVLRRLTSSVSCALDEAAAALTRMRSDNTTRPLSEKTSLVEACTDGDVSAVRKLLTEGRSIQDTAEEGESLLSLACSAGYFELAQQVLLAMHANIEDRGIKGECTPLMEASSAGHIDIVRLLVAHGAEINAHSTTGNTPLMYGCAGGHLEVVRFLLEQGASLEEHNENGHTPLMEAASAGHVEVAKILLEHGAGINTHSNEFKESALTLACYKGHLSMVKFLLEAGADQEHKTDEMHTALMEASMDGHVEVARLLLDSGAQVNMPTDSFESPLTLAACGGHVDLAMLLLERGANIEEVNDEGYTPLMEAAREGHEEMVALLLSQGANINAQTDETQETALTLACCGGFTEVADFLLKAGADIELGASTPLMEAAQEGHLELVKYLLENNANVHAQTQTGDTALTYACENGHTDVADLLLQYGADMEHESEGGRTPLMKACRAGHLCTVQFLISKGADVRRPTSNNDHTPISLACAGGHLSVVELLLAHGADPNHKLKDNSSTLIEAAKGGHTAVVQLLLDYPQPMMLNQQPTAASNLSILPGQVAASRDSPLSSTLPQPVSFFQAPNVPPTVLQEVPEAVRIVTQEDAQQPDDVTKQPMSGAGDSPNRLSEAGQQQQAASQPCKGAAATAQGTFVSGGGNHQLSKSRSAGAVFDTGLTSAEAQQVRTQPIAELEVQDVFATTHTVHFLSREEDDARLAAEAAEAAARARAANDDGDQKKQQILEELHKVDRDYNAKQGHNHLMLPFAVPQEQCQSSAANSTLPHALNIDMAMQQPQGLGGSMAAPMFSSGNMSHMSVHNTFYSGPSCLQSPGVPLKLAASGDSGTSFAPNQGPPTFYFAPLNGSVAVPLSTATTGGVSTQSVVKVPTVTTHTEVSQNTAISDRPKAKPVSKKEGKNVRKQPYQTNFCNPPQPLLFSQPMTQQQQQGGPIQQQQQQQPTVAANQQIISPLSEKTSLSVVDSLNVTQTLELDTLEQDTFDLKDDSQPDSLLTASILQQFHNNSQIRAAFVGSPVQSYPTTIDETIIAGLTTQQQDLPTQSDISRVEYFAVPTGNANPLQVQHTLYPYEHYLQGVGIGTVGTISNKEQSGAIYQAGFQAGINLMQQQLACPNAATSATDTTTSAVLPAIQGTAAAPLAPSCAHAIPNAQTMQSHLCQMPCNQHHHPTMVPTHHHLVPTHQQQQQQGQQANQVQAATQTQSQAVSNEAKRPAKSISTDASGGKKKGKVLYRHQSQPQGGQFQQGQGGQVDPNTAVTQYAGTPSQDCNSMAVAIAPPGYRMEIDAETESNHDTALTLACAGGHDELVQLLLARGAQIEHRDKKGFTPLILAATAGHEKTVEILLNSDADIEAQSERTKDTPLSLACSGGRYEVVELLLMRNANKEHRNVSDYTPLSLAASGGYVNIIKLLLSHGAEINSRTGSKLGISPLMLAAMNGHTSAVKLLLDMGSDINAQIETNRNTALTLACFQGRHEVVSLLLDRKANVEHRAKTGLTPLMEAASGGYVEVGRVLLDKGADVNATPVPSSRDTALTIAADKGHVRFVELLLCRGAAVEVKNKKGNSPLWLAANGGHLSVVELLYNLSADIDSQDNRKVSCLMAAFRKGHVKVVKWMVNHVTQFPSDQEMVRYIGTVSDKELLDKCNECMKVIRVAKDTQAAKANKNASNLLEEISLEKTREESKKAAAARKRERKKKKKLEKKVEKLKLTEENKKNENYDDKDVDQKDDEKDEEEPQEPASTSPVRNGGENPDKEEGDSGIDANSQGSCSSNEVKPKEKRKDKKKKKNSSKGELRNRNQAAAAAAALKESKDDKKTGDKKSPSPRKNLVFEATKHPAERDDFEATGNETYFSSSSPKSKKQPEVYESRTTNAQTSPKQTGKREEGWKEVVTRKSATQPIASEAVGVKKVSVPLNAISRVIGRGGCNINAIRGATGAYIEVEKQSKGQGERTITIKGTMDVVKKAHSFIHMLVKDNDIDILQLLPKAAKVVGGPPSTTTLWDKTQLATKKTAGKITPATVVAPTPTTTLIKPSTSTVLPSSSSTTSSNAIRLIKRTPPAAFTPSTRPSAPPRMIAQQNEKNSLTTLAKIATSQPATISGVIRPISKPITTVATQTFAAKLTESTSSTHHMLNVTVTRGDAMANAKPRMSQSLNVSQSSIGPVSPQAASTASSASSVNQMSPKHRRPSPTGSAPPNMQHFPSPGKLPFPNSAGQAVSVEQMKRSSTPVANTTNINLLEDNTSAALSTAVSMSNQTPPQYSLFNPQSVFQQSVLRRENEQKNFAAVTGGSGNTNQPTTVSQSFIDDDTPTVDAAKAPGYRGTTVSSPVSSKTSSNSTTPPNLSLPSSNYQQPLPIGSNIMHNRPSNQNDLVAGNSFYPSSDMIRPMMTHSDTNLYKGRSKMIMNFAQQPPQMAAGQGNMAPQPSMSRLNPKAADFSTSGQNRFSMDFINSTSSFGQGNMQQQQQQQYGKHMMNYSRSPSAPVPNRWHHVMQQQVPYNQQTKMTQPGDLIGLPMSIQNLARAAAAGGDIMENGEYGGMMTSPTMSPNLPAAHMTSTVDGGPHDERKPAGSVPPPIGTERARKSYQQMQQQQQQQQTPLISDHSWPGVEPKMYMDRSWPNSAANMDRFAPQMQKPMYADTMPPVMDNYQGMPMENSFGYANGSQMHFLHQQQMMNLRGNEYANDQLKMSSGMSSWDQPNMADMQDKAPGWSGMMPKWTNP